MIERQHLTSTDRFPARDRSCGLIPTDSIGLGFVVSGSSPRCCCVVNGLELFDQTTQLSDSYSDSYPENCQLPPQIHYLTIAEHEVDIQSD
ncbi:hypothetical protein AArc1_1316 [Natrarchaeobaculum sulfurireducens]|uniref:Uncharacterized protein n=1 Tax=Natrarchaeobaculum sulfurireducens TaxID=2044521 RepID=A0A346PDQ9_9EURY|nr:hypothetical protein AArc1_1316 [Natrarchaeobaculum sulfurireducens]